MQETTRLSVNYRKLDAQLPTALGGKSSSTITLVDIPKIDETLA